LSLSSRLPPVSWAALLVLAVAVPSSAQEPSPFLSRADFSFSWANLAAADQRFDWQSTIGFDLDLYDYGAGRLRLRGHYEAVLGRERRRYDLNQGTYAFEVSGTKRLKYAEVAILSQHVSRHVVDRDNPPSISWNTLGVRAESAWARGADHLRGEIELSHAMQQAYVDYTWISRARVSWRRPLNEVVAAHATAAGEVVGVQHGVVRNQRVCGGRIEGGVQFRGRAATIEVFGGYERRIDAYPTDRFRVRWFIAGARIVTSPTW
jgi:hypothetical protein